MGKLDPFGGLIREEWESGAVDHEILSVLAERGCDVSEAWLKRYRLDRGMVSCAGRPPALVGRQIESMRKLRPTMTVASLAERFGVSTVTVWRYCR